MVLAKTGNLIVKASDSVEVMGTTLNDYPSGLFTNTYNTGDAGDLTINTANLVVKSGSAISTSTYNVGRGGSLNINASNKVELTGRSSNGELSSLLSAQSLGTGFSGALTINTPTLVISDGAEATVSSIYNATAGNFKINANSIHLDNGKITARTYAGNGGNLNLNVADLLVMRRNSEISTTAGAQSLGGNGGNININAPFMVAVPTENSDITANAFTGRGGNVNIRTQSILGIAPGLKPLLTTSDITASSELGVQGQISIQELEVQPQQGLIELPEEVVDATRQVAQICPREPSAKPLGEFTVTGRGSLPPSPLEPLPGTNTATLATLDTSKTSNLSSIKQVPLALPTQIIEAQGWVKTSDGNIELVAAVPTITPSKTNARAACPTTKRVGTSH